MLPSLLTAEAVMYQLHCITVQYSTVQYSTVRYDKAQYMTAQYSTV